MKNRGEKMKKVIGLPGIIFCMMIIYFALCSHIVTAADASSITKEINIVYDDSGSMVAKYSNGAPVAAETKWSQAKYAMKVFVAMMGETDTINIYPMSGYQNDKQSDIVTVNGKLSVEKKIARVSKINTSATGGTPFGTVRAAGNDLKKSSADEKWLIVLTDGEFDEYDRDEETQEAMREYANDSSMNVIYVGIGDNITDMSSLDSDTFFSYNGINENKILSTITEIAKRVYNYQAIDINGAGEYSFEADIPVSKFIIFAQGNDISVEDIMLEGQQLSATKEDISVNVLEGMEKTPVVSNWSKIDFATGLDGHIITYTAENVPFGNEDGISSYSFKCNTDNVEVYFEPGVDVEAALKNSVGTETLINSSETKTVESGKYEVELRMVNPLNGKEIESGSSDLLGDVDLSMTLDKEGEKQENVSDGDSVELNQGEYTVTTGARFKGNIEKRNVFTMAVSPAPYQITFTESNYKIDAASLAVSTPIAFTITNSDGSEAQISKENIQVSSVNGLYFNIEEGENGSYTLVPACDNAADIVSGDASVDVIVTTETEEEARTGSGTCDITIGIEEKAKLTLTLSTPGEKYPKQNPQYMFSANSSNEEEYILVKVQASGYDGTLRDLTEDEWEKGQSGFAFTVLSNNGNFIHKYIIKNFCRQKLDFNVELGDEVSTYKLYLNTTSPINVLPNVSNLQVVQTIHFDSGLIEAGENNAVISIQPLGILMYLGRIFLILFIILLLILACILYIRKPKFDKDMKPNLTVRFRKNGVPQKVIQKNCDRKIRNRFSLFGPEKMTFEINSDGKINVISVDCVAVGKGSFRIDNIEAFSKYKNSVKFGIYTYDAALKKNPELNIGSSIMISFEKLSQEGTIIVKFKDK